LSSNVKFLLLGSIVRKHDS